MQNQMDSNRWMNCNEAMRIRSFFSWLAATMLIVLVGSTTSCVGTRLRPASQTRDRAFISYHPPPAGGKELRLAVKDLIDVKGEVTTAGSKYLAASSPPAASDAECLSLARQRGVRIVGKTNLTEFAVTVSGRNAYFGTPRNHLRRGLIPGGSSSGSAVAVASGMADVALGTDTAGSIRVPAACCGIAGLKTTYGLVSLKGVFPLSPKHLDTVGPMAKDVPRLAQGMDLLQAGFAARYAAAIAAKPSAGNIRIGRLYIEGTDPAIEKAVDNALAATGFVVSRLDQEFLMKWNRAQADGLTVAFADAWRNDGKYMDKAGVSLVTKAVIALGKLEYENNYKGALKRQRDWIRDINRVLEEVDFIALPTIQTQTPRLPLVATTAFFELRVLNRQNTVPVNFAGLPALSLPIPLTDDGRSVPVTSLQLIGPRLSEAALLNAGRLVESKHRRTD